MNLDLSLVHKGSHRALSFRWLRILALEWIFARPRGQRDCFGDTLSIDVCLEGWPCETGSFEWFYRHMGDNSVNSCSILSLLMQLCFKKKVFAGLKV